MKVVVYSHTHWDREWYLSQVQFQHLLVRTVDEILDLVRDDPRFTTFVADGQTMVIDDYLELRPERERELRALIAAGRLAIGPWYTMPDEWMPGGEALIRNLLYGKRACARFGAEQPHVGYVPDSFGHIEQLPQILQGFGIDNFLFSRGYPVSMPPEPLEFWWSAPDGTEVLAHRLPGSYLNFMMPPPPDDEEGLRHAIDQALAPYRERSAFPDCALLACGIDHTWVHRALPDVLEKARELYPEHEFTQGTIADYLSLLPERPRDLPRHTGQLRGALHVGELHGTLSSRVDNKIENERAQMTLEGWAEPLCALSVLHGGCDAQHALEAAWKRVLQCHAHDSICGCSMDRVHADVNARLRQAQELAEIAAGEAARSLNGFAVRERAPRLLHYGGLGGRGGVVEFVCDLPEEQELELVAPDGTTFPVQRLATRRLVRRDAMIDPAGRASGSEAEFTELGGVAQLPDTGPCGATIYEVRERSGDAPTGPVSAGERTLENDVLSVAVEPNGTLAVRHKPTGREWAGLHLWEDEGDAGGGYQFGPLPDRPRLTSSEVEAGVRTVHSGPLRGQLEISFDWELPVGLTEDRQARLEDTAVNRFSTLLTLDAGSDVLQCETTIDHRSRDHRLRLALPTGIAGAAAHAEGAFSVLPCAADQWEGDPNLLFHPFRNFVAVADGRAGMAFIGRGLHEYELVERDSAELHITMLRAVPFVFLCGTWETPEAQLPGEGRFEYALMFHAGDWREGDVPGAAAAFARPGLAQCHGDWTPPWERIPHANTWLGEKRGGLDLPTSTHRSTWQAFSSRRDGWGRREEHRLPQTPELRSIRPFELIGEHLRVSAFKLAEWPPGRQTQDIILRFYSLAAEEQEIGLRLGDWAERAWLAGMDEEPREELPLADGATRLEVRPFEIVTVRVERAAPSPV